MTTPIHLVLGDHAATLLREAVRQHGLRGEVHAIPDDPSHGPLDDGRERVAYMRDLWRGLGEPWNRPEQDAFDAWRRLMDRLELVADASVVAWCSDSVHDHVFLRMAAWWLRDHPVRLLEVSVPAQSSHIGVGVHDAADLARLAFNAREIEAAARAAMAREFVEIRSRPEPVRRRHGETIEHLPPDTYDQMLMQCLDDGWLPAARVVVRAMDRCEAENRMTDLFFSARLQALIGSGRIEASGDLERLGGYRVRMRR